MPSRILLLIHGKLHIHNMPRRLLLSWRRYTNDSVSRRLLLSIRQLRCDSVSRRLLLPRQQFILYSVWCRVVLPSWQHLCDHMPRGILLPVIDSFVGNGVSRRELLPIHRRLIIYPVSRGLLLSWWQFIC
jgi:hypothetical protein